MVSPTCSSEAAIEQAPERPDQDGLIGHERVAVEDEHLAASSSANVLISTTTMSAVEVIARRVHQIGARAQWPFITFNAGDLSKGRKLLAECAQLRATAGAGSVLLHDVERMRRIVQEQFLDVLDELDPVDDGFRLFTGTTVALFDRVVAGTFSEELFYRLNVLHLHGNGR